MTALGDTPVDTPFGGVSSGPIDLVEISADVTVNGSSGAQTTVIVGTEIEYDGETEIAIEFYTSQFAAGSASAIVELWEDSTSLCRIVQIGGNSGVPVRTLVHRMPTAGDHTYTVKAWKNGGTDATVCSGTLFAKACLKISAA